MTSEELRRAWLTRVAFPRGYSDCFEALRETLECEGGLTGVSVASSASDHPIGPEDEAIRYVHCKNGPEWLAETLTGLDPMLELGGIPQQPVSAEAAEATEMDRLHFTLRAFWGNAAPAASLYVARWEHFAFYARGFVGAGDCSPTLREQSLDWPELPKPWLERVERNLENKPAASHLRAAAGSAQACRQTAVAHALDLLQIAEAIPWHAAGPRFHALISRELPDLLPVVPVGAAAARYIESLANLVAGRGELPLEPEGEVMVRVVGREGWLGAIALAPPPPLHVEPEQIRLAEAAAGRIAAYWEAHRAARRTSSAFKGSKQEDASSRARAFWDCFCDGEPVLWAGAIFSSEAAVNTDRFDEIRRLNPSDPFPTLEDAGAGSLEPGTTPHQLDTFGTKLILHWRRFGVQAQPHYWNTWLEQFRNAFELRTSPEGRRLEDWFREEMLSGLDDPDPIAGIAERIGDTLNKGDDPADMIFGVWNKVARLAKWRRDLEIRDQHFRSRGGGTDTNLTEAVVSAAALGAIYASRGFPDLICGESQYLLRNLTNPAALLGGLGLDGTIPVKPPVRLALDAAFYLVMKHRCPDNSPVQVKLEIQNGDLRLLKILFQCEDYERFRKALSDTPLRKHLRHRVGASIETAPGLPQTEVVLNWDHLRRGLLTLLNDAARYSGGMLYHHGGRDHDAWLRESQHFRQSTSRWNPKTEQWKPETIPLNDAIDMLKPLDPMAEWPSVDRRAIDLHYIWEQFELMRVQAGHPADRVVPPLDSRERPGDHGRIFLYLPEWYEILLDPSHHSLLQESMDRLQQSKSSRPVKIGLTLGCVSNQEFRLYWADQGDGAEPDQFASSMKDETRGHRVRKVLERALLWCDEINIYSKTEDQSHAYKLGTMTAGLATPIVPEEADSLSLPREVWNHFGATHGFCVEFVFRVREKSGPPASQSCHIECAPDVIIVDSASARHRSFFSNSGLQVLDEWDKYDRLVDDHWKELWVHLSDFMRRAAGDEDLKALVEMHYDGREFSERGRRAEQIVVFTGGDESTIQPCRDMPWFAAAESKKRLRVLWRGALEDELEKRRRQARAALPPLDPPELGVIVVDEGAHDFRFKEHKLPKISTWEEFDRYGDYIFEEAWVHLGGFIGGEQKLEALISGRGDQPLFTERGHRARVIVVFTGGMEEAMQEVSSRQWWQDARQSDRLIALTQTAVRDRLESLFTAANLPRHIKHARAEGLEGYAQMLEKRLAILQQEAGA